AHGRIAVGGLWVIGPDHETDDDKEGERQPAPGHFLSPSSGFLSGCFFSFFDGSSGLARLSFRSSRTFWWSLLVGLFSVVSACGRFFRWECAWRTSLPRRFTSFARSRSGLSCASGGSPFGGGGEASGS